MQLNDSFDNTVEAKEREEYLASVADEQAPSCPVCGCTLFDQGLANLYCGACAQVRPRP